MAGSAANAVWLMRDGHLGSREPEHISRWHNALRAGFRAMPRCEGVTKNGARCQAAPTKGFYLCRWHLRGTPHQARAELELERRYNHIIALGAPRQTVERAKSRLAALGRKRLHRSWKSDPMIAAATIVFEREEDRLRAVKWLLNETGVDISKPLRETGRMATPRCLDRLLWASWRVVRGRNEVSEQFLANAHNRVKAAIRDDVRFFKRIANFSNSPSFASTDQCAEIEERG